MLGDFAEAYGQNMASEEWRDETSCLVRGLLRLKGSFDTTSFTGPTLVILTAMKKYGIILADNGSNWYISGETHEGWAAFMDDLVAGLRKVHGSDFEVVDTGPVSTNGL